MSRRVQLIVALVAVAIAVGAGLYINRMYASMVTTAEVVTPVEPIPAGALIEESMLGSREVPRPLTDEDIFLRHNDLVGRVAVVPLMPGMIVYRSFAVPQQEYRLVDDPALEVVSFPIDPARAVGGQLQPAHRVDIWKLVAARPNGDLMAGEWATATLVVTDVLVVDVRAASGQAVARQPQAVPGRVGGDNERLPSSPLQIITVAVPPETVQKILALVAEESTGARLWVSLAPFERVDTVNR